MARVFKCVYESLVFDRNNYLNIKLLLGGHPARHR